jgi:DNA-binding transcriptional regulator YiaG
VTPAELKAWRAEHGLSQRQAAEALDVSVRTLQEWEQDRGEPPRFLVRYCRLVGDALRRAGASDQQSSDLVQ